MKKASYSSESRLDRKEKPSKNVRQIISSKSSKIKEAVLEKLKPKSRTPRLKKSVSLSAAEKGISEKSSKETQFVLAKSASEGHFGKTSKDFGNIDEEPLTDLASEVLELSKYSEDLETDKTIFVRTRSLENIPNMPAYGELLLDASILATNVNKPKDHLYKILVIGDLGTGKTSIIKRYVHRFFTQHYRATIGVDFALKVLNWDENTVIRLQLWDIAGQERYGNMTRVYYKEAVGAFIVFDVTRRTTFESVANWKSDLDSKVQLPDGSPIPCVLLANKCDQQKEGLVTNPARMDEYCRENGFTAWLETSARDNINIDDAAKTLVQKILELDNVINKNKGGDQFSLADDSNPDLAGNKCSC
ncbi:ras-related protein Rab-32 [Sitophilus oryzae]|uniref:Ras-related protein Rab n=1 Tax=Sitophilus oryzae TaxID=7048 RepID=A0A6J2XAV8_SITOR|nr:ras-related protein Rab-32 [Sitophilus oryzae]